MPEITVVLGKAMVAFLVSLLLNYIYIAWVSRLRAPSDKEVLANLQITWKAGLSEGELYHCKKENNTDNLPPLPQPQQPEKHNKKKGQTAGGTRKNSKTRRKQAVSRARRKKRW